MKGASEQALLHSNYLGRMHRPQGRAMIFQHRPVTAADIKTICSFPLNAQELFYMILLGELAVEAVNAGLRVEPVEHSRVDEKPVL